MQSYLPHYSISYIKPLGEIVHSFGTGCHHCADDTQLYTSLSKSSGDAVEVRYLSAVVQWLKANKLKSDRTEVILVGKVNIMQDLVLPSFDGVHLTLVDSVKSLEVVLDPA